MVDTIDGGPALAAFSERHPGMRQLVGGSPSASISVDDGMYSPGNDSYYFLCGYDAARLCLSALKELSLDRQAVTSVLDYACGFGRVGRVLQACFPDALMLGADVDPKALDHYQSILGVETVRLSKDVDAARSIDGDFDLIWVGSLFTHLPEPHVEVLISDLGDRLSEQGILAFTLHGDYVVDRLAKGEKNYGLDAEGISNLVSEFKNTGFGFSTYPGVQGYGISATSFTSASDKIERASMRLVTHQARGWVQHQDFYAVAR